MAGPETETGAGGEAPSETAPEARAPDLHVAPGPHISNPALTTRGMMVDVLLALIPAAAMATWVFGLSALAQIAICAASCVVFEAVFTRMRGRRLSILDGSALVTGVILALSLPWSAPWYVGVIASLAAIGLGKIVFGGLGQNLFNPAMVGRAFVMISFAALLGAPAYVDPASALDALTQATPLTAAKQGAPVPGLWPLFLGVTNGSLGETSSLACILGGLFLCLRRTAAWQIPAGVILGVAVLAGLDNLLHPDAAWTVLHHLLGGSLLFGAFFIATDPVSSPLAPRGRFIFGLGVGILVYVIRVFSGYPEGVMFAVLLMNAATPLIHRATIPRPLGGPVPQKA
ncbi:MAG: RnfABCDGE type electron transport complex subunit D [Planctomycetes bacterium]|nr:RnfABCDGE type electron transport complex subunit D [Planctomycetota bacterium]